ncbi:hypothetical protein TIFTF001_009572 [Ficus carica]|uniref:Uncharacterized protein n=1 Tax=Ficus carica TaxID=3494 RepID=A0AA87ZVH9_FICCA|nr:hypothetical protein TIFTF001_009572 [Ficus carica]
MLTLPPSQRLLARLLVCVTIIRAYKKMVICAIPHRLGMDICDGSYVKGPPPNGSKWRIAATALSQNATVSVSYILKCANELD